MTALTAWDWFALTVLIVSVLLGLVRGLVRTAFALASWVVALAGALLGGPLIVASFGLAAPVWAVGLPVFLVLFLLTRLVGSLIARGLSLVGLGGVDRMLGAVVGTARAAIVIAIAALLASLFGAQQDPAWQQALCRPLLDEMVARLTPSVPAMPPARPAGIRTT